MRVDAGIPTAARARGDIRLTASIIGLGPQETPALVIGDLLAVNPEQLRFVLAHELQHTARSHRRFRAARLTLLNYGWLPFGALTPLPPTYLVLCAGLLWSAVIATAWAEEIICDVTAVRRHGTRNGARSWFAAAHTANRRAHRSHDLALPPLHPPLALRRRCVA